MDAVRAPQRLKATAGAVELLRRLGGTHGALMMHQSGGCCDGSAPMCYPDGEFIVGDRDVLLGTIGETPFYIGAAQYEVWKHTELTIDAVNGRGGMFSLDNGRERRFLVRSDICAIPGKD